MRMRYLESVLIESDVYAVGDYIIKRWQFNDFAENTYVVTGKEACLIIDPGCYHDDEKSAVYAYVHAQNRQLVRLLNTHAHLDHVFGNAWVADTFQLAPCLHEKETIMYTHQNDWARSRGYAMDALPTPGYYWRHERHRFTFDNDDWYALWTPGHSPGHVCYYVPSCHMLFTGDVLFWQGVGRTDLPLGDAKAMKKSLQMVCQLPSNTSIYPGHGAPSVLAEELRDNPFLQTHA